MKHPKKCPGFAPRPTIARILVVVLLAEMLPAAPGNPVPHALHEVLAAENPAAPFAMPQVPGFVANNISSLSGALSQCSGQTFAEGLVALASCAALGGEYRAADVELSCDTLNPDFVKAENTKIAMAISGQQCRKGQIAQARGKIDCLTRGASLIQAMIGQQRAQFEKEIQTAQSALRQLEQIKKGFEQQDETIGKRLNGDKESGAVGLLEAEQRMEKFIDELQGEGGRVEQFKREHRALADRKKFLLEQVQARTLELTTSCLARGGSDGKRFQCRPNTPDVDYFTYLGCLYEASFRIGEGGRVENDEVNRRRGQANVASFGRALQDMLQSVPRSIAGAPSSPQQLDRFSSGTELWFNFNDFKEGIRTRLSKFENRNFRVADRVLKKAEGCFNTAKVLVAKERQGAGTGGGSSGQQQGQSAGGSRLVDLQNEIKNMDEGLNSKAQKIFTDSKKAYNEAVRPLLGRNVNLPVEQCVGAKPSSQAGCMDQIVDSFEDLYLGKSELSKLNMVVPGNGAVRDLVIQCAGLKGCVADLQAQHDHLQSTVKQVKQSKQKYAAEANQKIEAMRTSLAQAMSFPNQMLVDQQDDLNRFLAGLKVDASVELEDVEGKAFEKDDGEELEGLYKNPVGEDFLKGIGAGSTPPLKKVGKDSFKEAYRGISKALEETDKEIAALSGLQGKLNAKLANCESRDLEKKVDKAQGRVDRAISDLSSCRSIKGWCSESQEDELRSLVNQMDGISGLGADGVVDSLDNGLNLCKRSRQLGESSAYAEHSTNCSGIMDDAINRARSAVGSLKSAAGSTRASSARSR